MGNGWTGSRRCAKEGERKEARRGGESTVNYDYGAAGYESSCSTVKTRKSKSKK